MALREDGDDPGVGSCFEMPGYEIYTSNTISISGRDAVEAGDHVEYSSGVSSIVGGIM